MEDAENPMVEKLRLIRQEQPALRREIGDVRILCLSGVDSSRRLKRRASEPRNDLEFRLKSELTGRFTHLETRMEQQPGAIAERAGALEGQEHAVDSAQMQEAARRLRRCFQLT